MGEHEVKLKRFAGPFDHIPFDRYVQSPVGLMGKQEPGQIHLIFYLSFPKNTSINSFIPREKCTVKYHDLDHAVQLCLKAGANCFLAKSDMKSAFRHVPIRQEDWRWLVMIAHHPVTGQKYYFYDKCVAFGSSISCCHFQRVSNAIEHILYFRVKPGQPIIWMISYMWPYLKSHATI